MANTRSFKYGLWFAAIVVFSTMLFAFTLTVPTPISENDAYLHGLYFLQRSSTTGHNHPTVIARNIGASNPNNDSMNPDVQAGQDYYRLVDPSNLRTTLANWKAVNGFDGSLPIVNSRYANAADLGFGRDTECVRKPNGDVACSM